MRNREKMSSVDTAWLRMDRPTNLMMIVGVLIFDGPVDYERLKATIGRRLAPFRRFRQRVVADASGAYWEDDPTYDIDAHLHRVALPGRADKLELERFAADMMSQPLDDSKPLWQITLIENYQGGAAVLSRIHHCIADGIALVGVMLRLTDADPAGDAGGAKDEPVSTAESIESGDDETDLWKQLLAPVTAAAIRTIGYSEKAWSKYLEIISQPEKATHYAKVAGAVTAEIAQLIAMPDDSPTRFKGKPGVVKSVAWSEPMPLDQVKAVGNVAGGSVNDVLLSCVAGALGAYLVEQGDNPDDVEIRALIPVNLRQPGNEHKLGNRFGLVALTLPLGIANPLARLAAVRARMEALKGSYQAPVTLGVLSMVGMAPKAVQTQMLDLLAKKATAVMTNVPGPQKPLYMAGGRLAQMMFWVPQSGDIGMGVSILSYNGGVQFGLVTDSRSCPTRRRSSTVLSGVRKAAARRSALAARHRAGAGRRRAEPVRGVACGGEKSHGKRAAPKRESPVPRRRGEARLTEQSRLLAQASPHRVARDLRNPLRANPNSKAASARRSLCRLCRIPEPGCHCCQSVPTANGFAVTGYSRQPDARSLRYVSNGGSNHANSSFRKRQARRVCAQPAAAAILAVCNEAEDAAMKNAALLAHIRQLCCLGLGGRAIMPPCSMRCANSWRSMAPNSRGSIRAAR
jgi:WS/DGAT/MGAT family acyltransferase